MNSATDDVIIRARGLSKVYRLYAKPHYRFLDIFGLLGNRKGAFTEHAALDGVDVTIRRGEKIGIIGRNGAGKSTFLKLATRVIRPTSGELEVRGKVHALLQIGTGFHPEFTGRENVYGYLAQLGIVGPEAGRRVTEITEFAELEEYIDQPIKTYSSGMAARLMFSTSTAITPDVLVLDEILGVGDAYFAQKSFERMRELCESHGTTLLLVTHDIYSAMRISNRMIWIDRGRVLMEGDGATVVKAYEDSVRVQEEQRLRARAQQRQAAIAVAQAVTVRPRYVGVELQAEGGRPQPGLVYLSEISMWVDDEQVASMPLGEDGFDKPEESHLEAAGTAWGAPIAWNDSVCRPLLNYGSPFHKVAGVLAVPPGVDLSRARLVITHGSDHSCAVRVRCFVDGASIDMGSLSSATGEWLRFESAHSLQPSGAAPAEEVNSSGVHGTGTIVLNHLRMVDAAGHDTHFVEHGTPVSFTVDYTIADPAVRERAQVGFAFHQEGLPTACRIVTRDLLFDARHQRTGRIHMHLPRMMLGAGAYSLTVMIAREGYFDEEQSVFFSISLGVYYALTHAFELEVTGGGTLGRGTVFVAEGEWSLGPTTEMPSA